MQRRFFLKGAAIFGCSAAAHPWLSTVTLAGSDGGRPLGDHRLVVVILRGAMDGLDVLRPYGDAAYAGLRPTLAVPESGVALTDFHAMHQGLGGLAPLWQAGSLGFVQACSTPYRDKRSHFAGQDQLEAGTGFDVPAGAVRDGWLNRLLQAMPGVQAETAYAVGREALPILSGAADVRQWAPETTLDLSPQARLLLEQVYHDDPIFQQAAVEAFELTASGGMGAEASGKLADIDRLVDFTAARLRDATRIVAFSLSGWDTHKAQAKALPRALQRLERVVLRMQEQLGPQVWGKTTLIAMTEFGRTARENGSGGTDHGTGGTMLLAGGSLRGGRVFGRWPGLGESDLYQGRDLMPTSDVREWAAWALRSGFGIDRALLESAIFPGLRMGDDPALLL